MPPIERMVWCGGRLAAVVRTNACGCRFHLSVQVLLEKVHVGKAYSVYHRACYIDGYTMKNVVIHSEGT